jgi:hypothetical protein
LPNSANSWGAAWSPEHKGAERRLRLPGIGFPPAWEERRELTT